MTVCGLLRLDGADVRRSALTGMLAASSIGLPAARRVHLDGPFGVVTAADSAAAPMPSVLVGPSGLVIVIAEHAADGWVVPGVGSVTVLRPGRSWRPVPLRSLRGGKPDRDAVHLGKRRDPGDLGDAGGAVDDELGDLGSRGERDRAADGDHGTGVASALMRAYRAAGQRALETLGEHLLAIVWEPGRRRMIVSRGGRRAEELVVWSDGRYFAFGMERAQVLAARPFGLARPRRLAAGETLPITVATRIRRPPFVDLPEPRGSEADVPAT
ncbi:hypothetical protein BBK14_13205 [Parafrankia soli]|uniref:Glutamine amidotransferase type-2 domain-containing protein n=1 Tax=Parafrankia soli TaxID=2599596 RepID=A0A1S1R301_9ACTN|nr:hypothetical protein [Parafrankia soli]OHV40149.1 hypothetical protein BBK14_13205 [Parafrankia soli]